MKTKLKNLVMILLCTVSLMALCFAITACNTKHTHTADSTWHADETYHWHECTADDGEILDKNEHTAAEAVKENEVAATCTTDGSYDSVVYCSVCGYEISRTQETTTAAGHTLTHVEAKAATCTEAGNSEYWSCSVCGKYYSDEDCETETTLAAATIAATGHTLTHVEAKAASCTEAGNSEYWSCSVCEKYYSDEDCGTETTLAAVTIVASHTLTHVEAKAATCTADGNSEYWYCTVCEKYFSDDKGETETTLATVTIAASHTLTHVEAKAATCTEAGNSEYWSCSVCGKYYSDEDCETETTLAAVTIVASHTLTHVEAKAASCTEAGNSEYWSCSVCGKYYSDEDCETETTLAAVTIVASHTLTHVEAKAATCTADGNSEYWYCTVCEKYFSDDKGETETTLATVTIAATGEHEYNLYDPKDDGEGCHYYICEVCGGESEHTAHQANSDGYTPVKDAAGNSPNYHQYTCAECGLSVQEKHTFVLSDYVTSAGNHYEAHYCAVCDCYYGQGVEHSLAYTYNAEYHWQYCTNTHNCSYDTCTYENCPYTTEKVAHDCSNYALYYEEGSEEADATCHVVSCACGYSYQEKHDTDGANGACSKCGYVAKSGEHACYDNANSDGYYDGLCEVCHAIVEGVWTVSGTTITAYSGSYEKVIVPSSVLIDGSMVNITTVGDETNAVCTTTITHLIISEGIETISKYSFTAHTTLEYLYVANSVTEIGTYAFRGGASAKTSVSNLKEVILGTGLTTIGQYAFQFQYKLTTMIIKSTKITSWGKLGVFATSSNYNEYGSGVNFKIYFAMSKDELDSFLSSTYSTTASLTVDEIKSIAYYYSGDNDTADDYAGAWYCDCEIADITSAEDIKLWWI